MTIKADHRQILLVVVALAVAACASGATPAPAAPSTPGATGSSAAAAIATAPAATAVISAGVPSAPAPTGPASPTGPAPAKVYDCANVVSEAEMRQATTLADASLINVEHWTDTKGLPEGETHCGYHADGSGVSIELTVATGAAYTTFVSALEASASQAKPGTIELPGIGDRAVFVPGASPAGVARTGGTLVLVFIADLSGSGLKIDAKAAITEILNVAIGRV